MANVLIRMGLRQCLANRSLLEKKLIPAICSSVLENHCCVNKNQYAVRQMSSSKRNVHHTRTSASLDEDHKSDSESDIDSDSDDEKKKPRNKSTRAQSHFWRRKMRTLHSHLDVNKDGWLSYDDFMLLGERFAKMGHLTESQKVEFQSVLRKMWEEQWGEISPYNLVDV